MKSRINGITPGTFSSNSTDREFRTRIYIIILAVWFTLISSVYFELEAKHKNLSFYKAY